MKPTELHLFSAPGAAAASKTTSTTKRGKPARQASRKSSGERNQARRDNR